jgi:hypothetical protein
MTDNEAYGVAKKIMTKNRSQNPIKMAKCMRMLTEPHGGGKIGNYK